jgi:hypothetical protein
MRDYGLGFRVRVLDRFELFSLRSEEGIGSTRRQGCKDGIGGSLLSEYGR